MAQFSFNSFNRERVFNFNTSKITGNYTNLEELYKKDGEGAKYQIKGLYISVKSDFNDESPILALADTYVNLPQHQLVDIKDMLSNKSAIVAINSGRAGFEIRPYQKTSINKKGEEKINTYYSANWCDIDPDDFFDEEEELD